MFSVVIPTIGRTSLEELLNSIPSSPLLVSVIVVGDARMATEQADAIAANLQLRTRFEIKWRRPVQPGVNAARNLGIQEAAADSRTEVLVFFDDDVVLSDFFSWEALRDVYKDAAVLAVGGNYISRDIFRWVQTGKDAETGKYIGEMVPCNYVPTFFEDIVVNKLPFPKSNFLAPEWYNQKLKGDKGEAA